MSVLLEKQFKFTQMVAKLLDWIDFNDYQVKIGYAYRDKESNKLIGGHSKSLHTIQLAIDLNLFKDGKYLRKTEDYLPLGQFWESIGGSWGGRFKKSDGNHFSLEHEGMK